MFLKGRFQRTFHNARFMIRGRLSEEGRPSPFLEATFTRTSSIFINFSTLANHVCIFIHFNLIWTQMAFHNHGQPARKQQGILRAVICNLDLK